MMPALRLCAFLCLLSPPVGAQSVVPVPRPSDADSAQAQIARELAGSEVDVATASPTETEARPLTSDEIGSFIAQIRACWNTTALPSEARNIVVRLGFSMTQGAEPIPNTFQLLETDTADQEMGDLAFLAARRAIIRCGQGGYDLPPQAFPYWERVEISFDPTDMQGG